MDLIELTDPELTLLLNNKESGFNYRERRDDQFKENYELYRDKVTINRLIQRQSVNLPLMKTTLRTSLKDVDDMPVIVFENLDNDKQAEVFQNEYWKLVLEENNAEIQDIVDKKQDFFFGRTFDQWQIIDGKIVFNVIDPQDMLVDRYMNPYDIDSSRFIIQTHIFVPLSVLERDKSYNKEAVKYLRNYFKTKEGLIASEENKEMLLKKNEIMADMGVSDTSDPVLGETYVELTMHFNLRAEKDDEDEERYLYVEAEDMKILKKEKLTSIIGSTSDDYWKTHVPYNTWGDDVDKQDFWTDGIADIVRTPNKVLNAWFSQLVENRTLRNMGMQFYDSSLKGEGFTPSTFTPQPFGWYPVPGKPSEVMQRVDFPDLSESLDEMQYVTDMVERATGATATQQGVQTERQITLGEVQMAQAEAKARVKGMSKFYTKAWKDRATKFLKLIEAGKDKIDAVKIYKKGRNTNDIFIREISPKDWMTEAGYQVRVWSQDEKKADERDSITKLNIAYMNMMDNPKLKEIYQRKLLEFADLKPDEITDVMDVEKKKVEVANPLTGNNPMMQNTGVKPAVAKPQQPMQPLMQPQMPKI